MAMRQVLMDRIDAWRERTGQRVALLAVGGVDAARRVRAGEVFDFVVLATDVITALRAEGRLDPSFHWALARSPMAVAVAADAPAVRIDSEAALRDAVVAARRIGSSTGPSGAALDRLLARWGLAEATAPRRVIASPGVPVASLVAKGEADLGFQQLSELVNVPGIRVLGRLPSPIEVFTEFSAGTGAGSAHKQATRAFLDSLKLEGADAALRRYGMEPARDGSGCWGGTGDNVTP